MTGHVVISGTGRCGTSFLVRWFDACGYDVGDIDSLDWHPGSRCGLERMLDSDAPKVVKDPWLYTYLDAVDPASVELLVLPVRDLDAVVRSRIDNETSFSELVRPASVNGGVVYDLSAPTLASTLARSFYALMEWAVTNDVSMLMLAYPAIVEDADYLAVKMHRAGLVDVRVGRRAWEETSWSA